MSDDLDALVRHAERRVRELERDIARDERRIARELARAARSEENIERWWFGGGRLHRFIVSVVRAGR